MSRYNADDIYCYPNSSVLKNKLDLLEQDQLDAFEADITLARIISIENNPIQGNFDFNHLKRIHFEIFQDIYDWAGEVRRVDILRESSRFANVRMIGQAAEYIFSDIAKENFFRDLEHYEVAEKLAHYLSEINVLHPFRDGNGRVQRVFISQLASAAGYQLDYSDLNQVSMYESMEKAFYGQEESLVDLIAQKLSKSKAI
jgi:cell filamentation protein